MILSCIGWLLPSTDILSQRSVVMSASVTVIPQLPEGSMFRGVYSSSLSLNLSTPSSGGTTAEYMKKSREGLSKSKRSYLGPSSVICTILLVAYSSLFGKHSWCMMNALVAGLPLLITRKSCPTSTRPSTLYLCHVFSQFYLMKSEGCIIRVIA